MKIESLKEEQYAAYDQFLLSLDGSLFYHSSQYKRFLEELLGSTSHYLLAMDNGTIRGVLPLMKTQGKYGTVYNSLPYYGSNGGVITTDREAALILLDTYNRLVQDAQTAGSTLIETPFITSTSGSITHDLTDERIAQWTCLDPECADERILMGHFDSSLRRNIKKALKSGITVDIENNAFSFLSLLHQENISTIGGRPKSVQFFEMVSQYFTSGTDYNIYIARKNGQPVAALLLFFFNRTVEYYTPAVKQEYRKLQPLSLTIFRAMIDCSSRGFTRWNWGGTWLTQTGVYRFKRKWGTKAMRYTYYIAVNNQDIYQSTQEEMLDNYNYFYVIPFSELKGER